MNGRGDNYADTGGGSCLGFALGSGALGGASSAERPAARALPRRSITVPPTARLVGLEAVAQRRKGAHRQDGTSMELHLVADTNLFFEGKKLEDLPWHELKADPIVLLLTKPVLDEVDRHKKSTGRTRSRALAINKQIRATIVSGSSEIEISRSSPRVVLRLAAATSPSEKYASALDYDRADERLVGIVAALQAASPTTEVALFTDDIGPAALAHSHGIACKMIPDTWKRPQAESADEKVIRELSQELRAYRAQEPEIEIAKCESADERNVVTVIRRTARPLSEAQIEAILAALQRKHPACTDFTPPAPIRVSRASGVTETTEFERPAPEAIAHYYDTTYPSWIQSCRSALVGLHESYPAQEPSLFLSWKLRNVGSRPASRARVQFNAQGGVQLLRLPRTAGSDNSTSMEDAARSWAETRRFPPAPKPPPFVEKTTRAALHASRFDLESARNLTYAGIGSDTIRISNVLKDFGALPQISATATLAELLSKQAHGLHGLERTPFLAPSLLAAVEGAEPKQRDPERFYFDDWPKAEAVSRGALTCELWRHKGDFELFRFQVLVAGSGPARGVVSCTVHADNLTQPTTATIVVKRDVQTVDINDVALAMVEAC